MLRMQKGFHLSCESRRADDESFGHGYAGPGRLPAERLSHSMRQGVL